MMASILRQGAFRGWLLCRAITALALFLVLAPPASATPNESKRLAEQAIRLYEANNYPQALERFQQAAQLGDAYAMYRIGTMFQAGEGVKANPALAKRWFEESAVRGNSQAMTSLGVIFRDGVSVTANTEKALNWLGEASRRGDANAMTLIGFMFFEGTGVAQNYARALEWFQHGAGRGDAASMNAIGFIYESGKGVPVNACTADSWYRKAISADPRLPEPRLALGIHIYHGACGKPNKKQGRELIESAAALGLERAQSYVAALDAPPNRVQDTTTYSYRTTEVVEYEIRTRYEAPPPPPAYVAPISPFYGTPCWGCMK
jgi:TPR repeat protein